VALKNCVSNNKSWQKALHLQGYLTLCPKSLPGWEYSLGALTTESMTPYRRMKPLQICFQA